VSILIEMPSYVASGADLSRASEDLGVRFEWCRGRRGRSRCGRVRRVRVVGLNKERRVMKLMSWRIWERSGDGIGVDGEWCVAASSVCGGDLGW
jgi:hypothetical protein